jgi:hypothetical protein
MLARSACPLRRFLHHDPVALDFVQSNWTAAAALAAATSGASTVPRISAAFHPAGELGGGVFLARAARHSGKI